MREFGESEATQSRKGDFARVKVFFFQKYARNYFTNPSGRNLCTTIFAAKFKKEKCLFPD